MGVHGLTTFLRKNRSILSKTIHFSPQDVQLTPLVVDGWSFIYKLLEDSHLPWVYGGEYEALSELVVKTVKAWLAVRLRPIFVFDGSTPPAKFTTALSRLNQAHVQQAILFFRTSAASRKTRRFLREARIIPPMTLAVCVHALLSLQCELVTTHSSGDKGEKPIEVHFADEEADSYAVELAGRVGGYVTGRDSDFVVFNSEGYLGYIPLEEMVWIASDIGTVQATTEEVNDGFQSVKKKKKATPERMTNRGTIPPDFQILSLSASLYTPSVLGQHLKLPVSLLPLLGAIVGNDYTLQAPDRSSFASNSNSFQNLLFERRLNLSQRISHASATLGMCLRGHYGKRKQKKPQSVMELIQMTVAALLTSSGAPAVLIGSGQQEAIVENIVEGTLPYAIAMRPAENAFLCETVCALHFPHECQLVAQMDRSEMGGSATHAEAVSTLYLRAYRLGRFSPSLMDILSTRTFWPEIFLENPDKETVARSVSRNVREFGYALLEEGVVIPAPPMVEEGEDAQSEAQGDVDMEEDPDELIDVVESDEEFDYEDDISVDVGKLRGALRELQFDDTEQSIDEGSSVAEGDSVKDSIAPSSSVRSPIPLHRPAYVRKPTKSQRKVVTEYVRRGARVAAEEIEVCALQQFYVAEDESTTIPIQLRSETDRLNVLFKFLQVDSQGISALPKEKRMSVLALRLVIWSLHGRSEEAGNSKEKQLEKWTRREARAFLASIAKSASQLSLELPIEISERAIQLTAQVSTALECIDHLVQILLLTDTIPGCAHRFSGLHFHSLLMSSGDADVAEDVWHALTNGLDSCFADERKGKKTKRKAQKEDSSGKNVVSLPNGRTKMTNAGSIYNLLADISS